ncbi:hypothetical protein Kpho02_68260 [Kitasatospora phosalacinea]|uniref:Uncharacterized protein n=1 Tax=Kitasatospora phosalacinea TaxID=2065 RepID=A0A9W6QGR2_9ACTN|nr:hypothetical protein [Kitasatospora phosalacinea]GLW74528.1 hypothetical protein Kpho02_68260 [Kitasatospora phosalacinea]
MTPDPDPRPPQDPPATDRPRSRAWEVCLYAVVVFWSLALSWAGAGGKTVSAFQLVERADEIRTGALSHAVTALRVVQWSGGALAVLSLVRACAPSVRLAGAALLAATCTFGGVAVAVAELHRSLQALPATASASLDYGALVAAVAGLMALVRAAGDLERQRAAG